MNKSDLIRATPGKPVDVVRLLGEQGVSVSLNLVRQVQKDARRKRRAQSRVFGHGDTSHQIRKLLAKGVAQAEIVKQLSEAQRLTRWRVMTPVTINLVKQVAYKLRHSNR